MEAAPSPTRQILLVDDDVAFTAMMKDFLLSPGHGLWIVHTAENYTAALACLKLNTVDLVVLDIRLPMMDGLQFLTLLKRTHPGLPVIILTSVATQENRAYSLEHGAALFLDKAIIAQGFEALYAALEAVAAAPSEGFRGMLRQVGLPDVLQMECLGRKSSILEIAADAGGGRIFISEGSIVHAEAGRQQGEAALFQLLALRGGEFRLKPYVAPARQTIDGHWESLLMEAARLQDESGAAGEKATEPSPDRLSAESAPAVASPKIAPTSDRRMAEIVLCAGSGEVLYEWQAEAMERRVQLLHLLSVKSAQLSKALPLGRVDRMEIETPDSRIVLLLQADRQVFVRSALATGGSSS